ncbi:putative Rho GTPase-activating protein syd-1 [Trichinella spiralis]|uniref:putative Rho GTPase-activating protein syd-1 n=1 Tax=Trichinella spiralis TaxID=6334 RepID=UPI0001EFEAAF|nr:putative Rho GTPase-activating protein syd-1 [Trichinella spiralis]
MHCQLVDQKIDFTGTKSGKLSNCFTLSKFYNSMLTSGERCQRRVANAEIDDCTNLK